MSRETMPNANRTRLTKTSAPRRTSRDSLRSFRSGISSWGVTITLLVVAVVAIGITVISERSRQAPKIEEFGKVGQEFFPAFVDPTLARELRVLAIDLEKFQKVPFEVKQLDNGLWVIPTHYNYPVDAEDRLARTASAIVGLTRGAMVTRWESDHSRYGVIDPETAEPSDEGIGRRISLLDEKGEAVVDMIVGNRVEQQNANPMEPPKPEYYVRRPDEEEVYIANLNIDLSTRFSDWINTDLLELQPEALIGLTINDYRIDEQAQRLLQSDVSVLKRDVQTRNWTLTDLDDPSAQVSQAKLMQAVETLTSLRIIGVRPKVPGLNPDMSIDPRIVRNREDLDRLQQDLGLRGLLIVPDEAREGVRLLSIEGELEIQSDDAVVYTLYFGRAFTGGQTEIEIGSSAESEPAPTLEAETEANAESASADDPTAQDEADENTDPQSKPGRFLFITALIDGDALGPEPQEPAQPQRPAELDDPSLVPEETPNPDGGEPISRVDRLSEIQLRFDAEMQTYLLAKRMYDSYQQRVKAAEEKVKEANRRFGAWYYVISGDDFESITLDRASLLEPRTMEEGEPGVGEPGSIPPGFPESLESEFPTVPPRLPAGSGNPANSGSQPPSLPAPGLSPETDPPATETPNPSEGSTTEPSTTEPSTTEPSTTEPGDGQPSESPSGSSEPVSETPSVEPANGEPSGSVEEPAGDADPPASTPAPTEPTNNPDEPAGTGSGN